MELIDLLFFPGVVIAGMLLWAFATYERSLPRNGFTQTVRERSKEKSAPEHGARDLSTYSSLPSLDEPSLWEGAHHAAIPGACRKRRSILILRLLCSPGRRYSMPLLISKISAQHGFTTPNSL